MRRGGIMMNERRFYADAVQRNEDDNDGQLRNEFNCHDFNWSSRKQR